MYKQFTHKFLYGCTNSIGITYVVIHICVCIIQILVPNQVSISYYDKMQLSQSQGSTVLIGIIQLPGLLYAMNLTHTCIFPESPHRQPYPTEYWSVSNNLKTVDTRLKRRENKQINNVMRITVLPKFYYFHAYIVTVKEMMNDGTITCMSNDTDF